MERNGSSRENSPFDDISYQIRKNKKEIAILANKQRQLKDTRKGLFEILSQIRGFK